MKKMIVAVCVCAAVITHAQIPPFGWAKRLEGGGCKALTNDAAGNLFTLGQLPSVGNFDFDPGPATFFLNGASGTTFISKLNSNGEFVSAIQLPLQGSTSPEGIYIDAAQNIYITGYYTLTQDFDPGPGVFNLTGQGQNDVYVLKLNAAGGFVWAKSMGGTQGDLSFGLAVGPTGIVYISGYFNGTSDFDPGPGVFSMTSGISSDSYIAALDADGNFLWAQQIAGGVNQSRHLTINSAGELIMSGFFSGTKDLNPGAGIFNVTSVGSSDIYVLKLNAAGGFIWAVTTGGIGSDSDEGITTDASGNVYVTGSFRFTSDFDPGPGVFEFTAAGDIDIFVWKLDASGGFIWARQFAGTSGESPRDITTDATGNVYTTGLFVGTTDFDPGPATFPLTSILGGADIFISKLDAAGNFVWAFRFGAETSEDRGIGIVTDAAGNLYTAGMFDGQVDFDPGPASNTLLAVNQNVFVFKLGMGVVLPLTLLDFSAMASQRTTILQWQTSSEINTDHFDVEWSTNGQVYTKITSLTAAGNSTQTLHYSFTHNQPADGANYYRLKMVDKDGRFTYSRVVFIKHTNDALVVNVFPNPVNDVLQLTIESKQKEVLGCRLITAAGKTILAKSLALSKGSNQFNWSMQSLAAGNYFIVFDGNRFETIQINKY